MENKPKQPTVGKYTPWRMWDTIGQRMLYPQDLAREKVFLGADGVPVVIEKNLVKRLSHCLVLFQTGMRAVGDITLWDGDICDADVVMCIAGMHTTVKKRGVMVWDHIGAKWMLRLEASVLNQQGEFQVSGVTHLGNIFQHADLLQNQKIKHERSTA